jgi:GWxTD domain-containing protein
LIKRVLSLLLLAAAVTPPLTAQSLGEHFEKAKQEVRAGSWSDALKTLNALETESRKPGSERQRAQLEPVLAFYRAVCFADLDKSEEAQSQFETYLASNPGASLDASLYSKKALKAMDQARKSIAARGEPPSGIPSIATAYRDFRMSSTVPDPPREDWADGPVKFLMTSDERRDWTRLPDPISRAEFVTKFWTSRDPMPETPNEMRQEFERRVAFADQNFTQGEVRGALTDRGMVFILLGAPTYVGRRPIGAGEDSTEAAGNSTVGRHDLDNALNSIGKATSGQRAKVIDSMTGPGTTMTDSAAASWQEVWHYRHELLPRSIPYQQVDFDFITRMGYGKNVLQRNSAALTTIEAAKKLTKIARG